MKELAGLKRAAAAGQPKQVQQLHQVLAALANSASFVDDKKHALLITEVQGISLWRAEAVRPCC